MALLGIGKDLGERGIQTDFKVAGAASAGTAYMLGSGANYVQLASNAVSHVLDGDVVDGGNAASDIIMGVEKYRTATNSQAYLRELKPGDIFRTDQLVSTGSTAVDGTTVPNTALGVNPANGKLRLKQATDVELFRVAPEGNLYDTDGSLWVEVTQLS